MRVIDLIVKIGIKLLPCPFCGGNVELEDYMGVYNISCLNCGLQKAEYSEDSLIKWWNTRACLSIHDKEPHND